jgi:hypothetical protein
MITTRALRIDMSAPFFQGCRQPITTAQRPHYQRLKIA